jgi:two-component system KDP operon response regulator KdpE
MNISGHSSASVATAECRRGPRRPRVLVIDDDPNLLQAVQRGFRRYEVDLLQAYHGTHGIWLATTQSPDVIVTDLRMPQGRGEYVVDHLLGYSKTCHIPIIVLTGVLDDGVRHQMLKRGVEDYLTKPVGFERLCQALRRFVDLREAPSGCSQ